MAAPPRGTSGIGNPVTPQSLVVVNGQFDRVFYRQRTQGGGRDSPWPNVSEENFAMMKHELAFMHVDPVATFHRGSCGVNDPDLRVFTSCNGFPLKGAGGGRSGGPSEMEMFRNPAAYAGTLRRAMRRRVEFIGVALTTMPNVSQGNTHCSVVAAGVVTVINSGPYEIDIGSRVVWDLPDFAGAPTAGGSVSSFGSPASKRLFQTLPWDKAGGTAGDLAALANAPDGRAEATDEDELRRLFEAAVGGILGKAGAGGSTDSATRVTKAVLDECKTEGAFGLAGARLEAFLRAYVEFARDLEFRSVGTALSRAAPGQPFDLLLRYNRLS